MSIYIDRRNPDEMLSQNEQEIHVLRKRVRELEQEVRQLRYDIRVLIDEQKEKQ